MIKWYGKRVYINLKVVVVTKQDKIIMLIELSKTKLHCSLDDNTPDYIPPDLICGTYRWFLYLFSNMYSPEDVISKSEKLLFISIFKRLRDEHTISWTRDTLIALNKSKSAELKKVILKNIRYTENFYTLKVNLYLYRSIQTEMFYADPFVFKHSENLKKFLFSE
jgi:hypothetical protein